MSYCNPITRLFYIEWKFCGCGSPEEVVEYVRDVLKALDDRSNQDYGDDAQKRLQAALGPEPASLLTLYWLDANDLTEHGGSVGGSWLTDKGRRVLRVLQNEQLMETWSDDPAWVYTEIVPEVDEILAEP